MPRALGPADIQLPVPTGKAPRRATIMLPHHRLHPIVRIAHRRLGPLNIAPRIILDHELVLILRGRGELTYDSAAFPFEPQHLFFLEPFIPHAFRAESAVEHLAVHFDFAPNVPPVTRLLQRPAYQVRLTQGLRIPHHVVLQKSDPVERALFDVITARARAGAVSPLAASAHLLRAIVQLLERSAPAPSAPPSIDHVRIRRALDFVEAHLAQKLSAADLAHAADTSPSHFNRIFRQWSGTSPMDFLRTRRIEHARRLLADHQLSIKQIAAQAGFDDPFHFSRVFRQIDGLSPSQFRAALLAPQQNP
jgi:AraC-like DNA-binding protein